MPAFGRLIRFSPLLLISYLAGSQLYSASPFPHPQESFEREAPRILILNSYHRGFTWTDSIVEGMLEILLQWPQGVDLYIEYLDLRRMSAESYEEVLFELLRNKYSDERFEVVLVSDDPAFDFLLRHRHPLIGDAPVVFCGLNNFNPEVLVGQSGITGVTEHEDIQHTLELATRLHPQARQLVIITDNDPGALGQKRTIQQVEPKFAGYQFDYLDGTEISVDEIETQLQKLPANSLVFLFAFHRGLYGEVYDIEDSTLRFYRASPAPMYGFNTNVLHHGIVGGRLNDGLNQGREAGRLVLRILEGEPAARIPVLLESRNPYIFDHREVERWKLDSSRLPEGSIIVNLPESIYKRYRAYIIGTLAFLALQTLIISYLLENIRRRRKAEEMLKRSEQSLSRAQSVARIGSWERDLDSGELMWSAETFRIFGVDPSKDGANLEIFLSRVHPEDRDMVRDASEKALREGIPYSVEHRVLRPDGTIRLVHEQAEIIRDRFGNPRSLVGTVQDVTDARRLEVEVRQAQKMEAVGRLAGGIAHDFNNLMMAVTGYSELVLKRLPEQSEIRTDVEEIRKAGIRAATLTSQLLSFSRKQVLQPKTLNLNQVVYEMSDLLHRVLGSNIHIQSRLQEDLGFVEADPGRIEQVVLNLAINARDAMPEGGTIVIETKNVHLASSRSRASELPAGDYVSLAVIDDGEGMDERTKANIFEPFFTTKDLGKGTGLGLSTVYGIVRQSGGDIEVESKPGQGSTFRILLPRVLAESHESEPSTASTTLAEGSETILVVEDEDSVRRLIQRVLVKSGYRVIEAQDAGEALKLFRNHTEPIRLVITDQVMPGSVGVKLIQEIASYGSRTGFLLISGFSEEVVREAEHWNQDFVFLQKPFTPQKLNESVREILDSLPGRKAFRGGQARKGVQ